MGGVQFVQERDGTTDTTIPYAANQINIFIRCSENFLIQSASGKETAEIKKKAVLEQLNKGG